jgi:hypothetical protein
MPPTARPVAPWRRGYWFLIAATSLSVALADWLFYGHPVGWTAGLFAAFVLALLTLRGGAFLRNWRGVLVLLAAGGLVAALVEEPTSLAVLLATLAASMLAVLNRNAWPGGTRPWAVRLVEGLGFALARVVTDNRIALRWLRRRPMSGAGPARLVTVWALPVILGVVFVALFRAANPIIARLVGDALDWLGDLLSNVLALVDLPRNVFWACVAAVVYALLRVRRSRRRAAPSVAAAAEEWDRWSAGEGTADPAQVTAYSLAPRAVSAEGVVIRCLLVFNALFAVQTALDAAYLFGGATLPDGMTFAQYAHRGAYPLVATALLAAAFVLIAFRPGGAAERSALARRLVYAWVAQNVFLTVTAAWRLDLYVGVYSLTRLRVAAGLWMLLVATGLVWIGCRIVFRRDNAWLLNANVLTTLAVLYACCFVNFDRIIADYNVAHCREAGGDGASIDADYLYSLGPDALPALRRVKPMVNDPSRRRAAEAYCIALTSQLREELSDWRGWTLRRWRTRSAADPISGASTGG